MKKTWILIVMLLWGGWVPATSFAREPWAKHRPLSGEVDSVHPAEGVIQLASHRIHVPPDVFDLRDLSSGTPIVVEYRMIGDRMVATHLEAGEDLE